MHVLFAQVLGERDLSKAGDLFSLDDGDIEGDLSEVLRKIREITDSPEYLNKANDQSVVEICITRVTSSIRETNSIEKHAKSLVILLESCLKHNLRVGPDREHTDPPHAKIASDIMSCIFLNYSCRIVMSLALPVAVKFLYQGNRELSRNLSSYLSLAAIDNAPLLAQHTQQIIQSIIGAGNKSLARVLPQIYHENRDPIHDHMGALVCLIADCEAAEQNSLLQLFGLVAKEKPRLLEKYIKDLCLFLPNAATSPIVLQTFVDMAIANPEPFLSHMTLLKQTTEQQPATLVLVAKIMGACGKVNKTQAKESVGYLVSQLGSADSTTVAVLLGEVKEVAEVYPSVLPEHMATISQQAAAASVGARILVQQITDICAKKSALFAPDRRTASSQTEGVVTVIQVGNPAASSHHTQPRLIAAGRVPIHKNASTSTREINFKVGGSTSSHSLSKLPRGGVSSTSVSVVPRPPSSTVINNTSRQASATQLVAELPMGAMAHQLTGSQTAVPHQIVRTTIAGSKAHDDNGAPRHMPTVATTTPSTTIPHMPITNTHAAVPFNAIPFRDAVQQFCEKHLDKIKHYIDYVSTRLPLPIKATSEESKAHRKHCKLHFICFGRGDHCLYDSNFFTIRTKQARTWIHLMFLATQARSEKAVSQQDPSVGNLKATWDRLRTDSGNSFLRLVTSNFPSTKDQDLLISELQSLRFFDVFEYDPQEKFWACFLCIHPEKVTGLLQSDGSPIIEGQLKEKKGKWKFLKRWKTRHFSLSGAQITYSKKDKKATLLVSQIQSVKAVKRGVREIPKAFEIFTSDNTYVLKASGPRDAEQWVQALQIAVARTKSSDHITDFDIETWAFGPSVVRRASNPTVIHRPGATQTKL